MPRRDLDERLTVLEARVTPASALRPEEIAEMTAQLRAEGKSEREVTDALQENDCSVFRRGLVGIATYDSHALGFGPPGTWACRHPDPVVSLTGWLAHESALQVATPGGPYRVDLAEHIQWQELGTLGLHFLSYLIKHEDPWLIFWGRPQKIRDRYGLAGFYVGTALRRARRFEAEQDSETVAALRDETSPRIEFALSNQPEHHYPWDEESYA